MLLNSRSRYSVPPPQGSEGWHTPATQVSSPVQDIPHPPQLLMLEEMSMQIPLHNVCPPRQSTLTQTPALQ
jgi:hypothetical protein